MKFQEAIKSKGSSKSVAMYQQTLTTDNNRIWGFKNKGRKQGNDSIRAQANDLILTQSSVLRPYL